MDLDQAYNLLGLEPYATFFRDNFLKLFSQRLVSQGSIAKDLTSARRTGKTTHACVSACVEAINSPDGMVLIITQNEAMVKYTQEKIDEILKVFADRLIISSIDSTRDRIMIVSPQDPKIRGIFFNKVFLDLI